jgi:hypothetical protein
MRTLHGAQMTYSATQGGGNYAGTAGATGDVAALNELRTAQLIDTVLGAGTKSGYTFVGARTASTNASPATFFFSSVPTGPSGVTATGTRRFGINTPGVIVADGTTTAQYTDATVTSGTALAN